MSEKILSQRPPLSPAAWARISYRMASICNAAGSVSIRNVARRVLRPRSSSSSTRENRRSHQAASVWCSTLGT